MRPPSGPPVGSQRSGHVGRGVDVGGAVVRVGKGRLGVETAGAVGDGWSGWMTDVGEADGGVGWPKSTVGMRVGGEVWHEQLSNNGVIDNNASKTHFAVNARYRFGNRYRNRK